MAHQSANNQPRGVDSSFVNSSRDASQLFAPLHEADQQAQPSLHEHNGHKPSLSRHFQALAPPFLKRGDSAPPLMFRLRSLEFKQMSPSQPKSHQRSSQPSVGSDSRHCSPRSTGAFFGNVNSNHPVNVINISIALERKRTLGDEERRQQAPPPPPSQAQQNADPSASSGGGYDRNSCCGLDLGQFIRFLLSLSTAAAML